MSDKIQPIREPGSLVAVTVDLREIRKRLDGIVEHINSIRALAGKEDELRSTLAYFRTACARLQAAVTRIADE